ncbi:MAG: BBP7 family outer membrane beta-barrel protein [Pirellulaceae bacterium]|nr:BBP7 family outer membrane beta-barrel protein [Pirellulaceae bacterium]
MKRLSLSGGERFALGGLSYTKSDRFRRFTKSLISMSLLPAIVVVLWAGQQRDAAAELTLRSGIERPTWSPNRPGQTRGVSRTSAGEAEEEFREITPEELKRFAREDDDSEFGGASSLASRRDRDEYTPVRPKPRITQDCNMPDSTRCESGSEYVGAPLPPVDSRFVDQSYPAGNIYTPPTPVDMSATPYCRAWARAEALLWWMEGSSTPPLVTTGTGGSLGELDDPDTRILFGGTELNDMMRVGGRFGGGYWFTPKRDWAIEGDYFFLQEKTTSYHAASDGDPILARPFYNIVTGDQDSHVMAYPDLIGGTVDVSATSRLQGAELLLRRPVVVQRTNGRNGPADFALGVELLAGYRFLDLAEDLRINESLEAAGPSTFELYDLFKTKNQFHGAQVGFVTVFQQNRFTAEFLLKLGLGNTRSKVVIDGETVTTVAPLPPVTDDGGLLALTTNMGTYTQNNFAVVPELGVTLGYDINDRLRASVGYTFIYWSRVARPGDQIDMAVNPSYIPNNGPPAGPASPAFSFNTTDMWMHGVNLGLDLRF